MLSSGPDLLGKLESTHWFLVADVAGVLRGLTHGISVLMIVAVLLLPLTFFVLWHTAFGLRLRSAGENPWAAESLGVNVYRIKYVAVVLSGAFAGLGGVFLVFFNDKYVEGQTQGRGFIGLAAMIFGNWRPGGLAGGSALFGYASSLQLRSSQTVTTFFLFGAVLLLAYLVLRIRRLTAPDRPAELAAPGVRQYVLMAVAVLGAAVLFWLWLVIDKLPNDFVFITPHVLTLLVLLVASQRLRMPKADGVSYRRGNNIEHRLGRPAGRGQGSHAVRVRAVLEISRRGGRPGGRRADRHRLQRRERLLRPGPVRRVRPRLGAAALGRRPAGGLHLRGRPR